jgi:hypothetical protein
MKPGLADTVTAKRAGIPQSTQVVNIPQAHHLAAFL